jgi:hypothetical protein
MPAIHAADPVTAPKAELITLDEALSAKAGPLTAPLRFRFAYQGLPIAGELAEASGGGVALSLVGRLGRLPYSAHRPELRAQAFRLLQQSQLQHPDALYLHQGREVHLRARTMIEWPASPVSLVASLVAALSALQPLLTPLRRCLLPL